MKQVFIKKGSVIVDEVPAPLVEEGGVLVEVAYSLISTGTEVSGVEQSGRSLVQRALDEPDRIQQVIEHLRKQGIKKTVAKIQGQSQGGRPTGYSCSGLVVQLGQGVTDLQSGD